MKRSTPPMSEQKEHECQKCHGTRWYAYDENHSKICEFCCPHDQGVWKLEKYYGDHNGMYCCVAGCGTIWKTPEDRPVYTTEELRAKLTPPKEQEDVQRSSPCPKCGSTIIHKICPSPSQDSLEERLEDFISRYCEGGADKNVRDLLLKELLSAINMTKGGDMK